MMHMNMNLLVALIATVAVSAKEQGLRGQQRELGGSDWAFGSDNGYGTGGVAPNRLVRFGTGSNGWIGGLSTNNNGVRGGGSGSYTGLAGGVSGSYTGLAGYSDGYTRGFGYGATQAIGGNYYDPVYGYGNNGYGNNGYGNNGYGNNNGVVNTNFVVGGVNNEYGGYDNEFGEYGNINGGFVDDTGGYAYTYGDANNSGYEYSTGDSYSKGSGYVNNEVGGTGRGYYDNTAGAYTGNHGQGGRATGYGKVGGYGHGSNTYSF